MTEIIRELWSAISDITVAEAAIYISLLAAIAKLWFTVKASKTDNDALSKDLGNANDSINVLKKTNKHMIDSVEHLGSMINTAYMNSKLDANTKADIAKGFNNVKDSTSKAKKADKKIKVEKVVTTPEETPVTIEVPKEKKIPKYLRKMLDEENKSN